MLARIQLGMESHDLSNMDPVRLFKLAQHVLGNCDVFSMVLKTSNDAPLVTICSEHWSGRFPTKLRKVLAVYWPMPADAVIVVPMWRECRAVR